MKFTDKTGPNALEEKVIHAKFLTEEFRARGS